jgi:hypothetical protein
MTLENQERCRVQDLTPVQVPHRQERDDAAFSLPFVHARLPDGDEHPAGAVGARCCGRVAVVALHLLTLVVMADYRIIARF